mmetsp:Transcript_38338/g.63451  ORF Transcript_38338/g.63451 Transcript_38338/m.63451 type:complete len:164 (+) Transcript_38338:1529-2020(+)
MTMISTRSKTAATPMTTNKTHLESLGGWGKGVSPFISSFKAASGSRFDDSGRSRAGTGMCGKLAGGDSERDVESMGELRCNEDGSGAVGSASDGGRHWPLRGRMGCSRISWVRPGGNKDVAGGGREKANGRHGNITAGGDSEREKGGGEHGSNDDADCGGGDG